MPTMFLAHGKAEDSMIVWITKSLGFAPCGIALGKGIFCLDVRDLVDGKGNNLELLRNKIKLGTGVLRSGKRLVVCCDKGLSRSVAVSIGIVSLLGKSFDKSLELFSQKVKDQSVNLNLIEDVRKCLNTSRGQKGREKRIDKIMVTGSTGFIGKALVKKLSNNYFLFCPKRHELDLAKDVLTLYREVRKRDINLIVDVAHPRLRNSLESLAESVLMIRNVLEICRICDLPLVFVSSLVVFEGNYCNDISLLKSDLEPRPVSIYGQSKALCEELIHFYRNLYGLNVVILRSSLVYGEMMDKTVFLCKFARNAINDEPITVHRYLNGFQQLDLLYIDDLIDAIEDSVKFAGSQDINLGTGKGISTLDLANLIITITGSKSKVNIVDVENFAVNLVPDTRKAQELLNWQAKTGFEVGLRNLLLA